MDCIDKGALSIDQPDYDDPKEPYSLFGLAAYYVQCFEQSLILLIAALQAGNPALITKASFEGVLDKLDRKTMGELLRQVSALTTVDGDLAARMSDLLIKRNYLMHHFFERNADKWFSDDRRRAMLDELRALAHAFQGGNHVLTRIYEPLWHRLGVTEEVVRREFEKLRAGTL